MSLKKERHSHPTRGGRFQKALDPRVALFQSAVHFDYQLFKVDIQGSQVHATMLAKQGLITFIEAETICQGLTRIHQKIQEGKITFDVNLEDIHMNIEYLLEQEIGAVAKKLHTGRSRNDQVCLDLRLFLRNAVDELLAQMTALENVLIQLIAEHQTTVMPGYTHLQKAQPITLGQHLDAYRAMFDRDKARLHDGRARMNYCPLGAGALAGSQLPLDREFVATQLGFTGIIENTLDAVSSRDFALEFCATASILMMHLSRFSEDIILWATDEFGFVTLDDAFATGSSLMPNKRNPDVMELIRGKSGRVFGHLIGLLTMMKGLPLAYNKDLQEDKEPLFDTIDTLQACLTILPSFLTSLVFNKQKMANAVATSYMDATFWVEQLVLKGMAFRDAHTLVGQWVVQAQAQGRQIKDFALELLATPLL